MSDIEAEFADLAAARASAYTDMDRYSEFRALFLGSDMGKRVLYEILGWGHVFHSSAAMGRFEPNRVMFNEGERNLALKIFATARVEPKAKPGTQSKNDPEN